MRVLVFGTGREDRAGDSMAHALSSVHDVSLFAYERGLSPFKGRLARLNSVYHVALKAAHRPKTYGADRRFLGWLGDRKFDLAIITIVDTVPHEVVSEIRRRTGAMVVGWFSDAIVNINETPFAQAPYERIFFKDKVVVDRFRKGLGSERFEFLAQAFDPALHRPAPLRLAPPRADVDAATFGNSYRFRAIMLGSLLDQQDIRTVIYGTPSWAPDPRLLAVYRPPVFGLRKSAAMRAAAIALNTNHFAELGGVNKRTFELCAMGAFQLTDGPTIEEYFEPGAECATFRGPDDLVDKVRYYLARPEERAEIARRGLARAFREHTYQHRLNEIFERIPALRRVEKLPIPAQPLDAEWGLPPGGVAAPGIRAAW